MFELLIELFDSSVSFRFQNFSRTNFSRYWGLYGLLMWSIRVSMWVLMTIIKCYNLTIRTIWTYTGCPVDLYPPKKLIFEILAGDICNLGVYMETWRCFANLPLKKCQKIIKKSIIFACWKKFSKYFSSIFTICSKHLPD